MAQTSEERKLKRAEYRARYYAQNADKCRAATRAWYSQNKARVAERDRLYRQANPHVLRARKAKEKYGVTAEQLAHIKERQEGKCAICGGSEIDRRGRDLSIDHCHKTGKVRGLLCSRCNTALGLMLDDPMRLRAAIAYLESAE